MKLSELYYASRKRLMQQEDPDTAGFLARNLLCHILGVSREKLLTQMENYASQAVCAEMELSVNRLLVGEPLAYVLGEWDFYGMTLLINKHVLIPRDDTCAVTDLAIKQGSLLDGTPRILDLCCGSGCIGLAIASNLPGARVTLADLSEEALAVAKQNITLQKKNAQVTCVRADALGTPPAFLGKFDLIVSNPPYITTREMDELPGSVKDYEPHMALHGGEDGLIFYRSIAEKCSAALKPGGCLCFEFGMGQGDSVCRILEENGYTILERARDNNDIERAVIAQSNRKEEYYGYKEDCL